MQQEINLCLLLPQQKKPFLTLQRLTLSYGIFVLLLALHFCFEWWGKHRLRLQVEATTQELNQVEGRLAQIHEQYPMLDLKDMEASLRKLQDELEEKNRIFDLVSGKRIFSSYLLGIAKAAVPDLWLVDIQAEMDEKDLTLKGYAMNSSALQRFINQLTLQTEFSGLNFQLQEVKKEELEKEVVLHFIISTKVSSETQS